MTSDNRTGRARRRLMAAAALLAPVLIIAFVLTAPPGTDVLSEDKTVNLNLLATVAANRDRTAIAGVLIMFALMSLLAFIVGLAGVIRQRGAWLATLGAAMASAGCFVVGVVNAFWIFNVKATHPSLASDRDAMAQLIGSGHWTGAIYFVFHTFVFFFGWLILAFALGRSRLVPRWQAALLGVSVPVLYLPLDRWAGIVSGLLMLVAILLLAPLLVRGPIAHSDVRPATDAIAVGR